ncbi:MAG: histidine phosphatase family protein, partial [Desulfobacterales bacterium]|nr:histidine phosphatase family protein [Desulfobacterales bacterium]
MKETTPAFRFGLVRHAPTEWNREKRIQGRRDVLLTPEGEELARAWGQRLSRLSWDAMCSSSSQRALKTAELMNQHLKIPLAADDRLREQNWGSWTGKTLAQIQKEAPDLLRRQVQ